jgi:hypothetical protein
MRRDDIGSAAAARERGLRTIRKITWGTGVAGVICSALIAAAFGHHAAAAQPRRSGQQGSILVPAQPPAPSQGAGQVTSGAS